MAANYRRMRVSIEGPSTGPWEITHTTQECVNNKVTTETETIKVSQYTLHWNKEDVLG